MTYIVHGATGAQGKPVLLALRAAGKSVMAVGREGDDLGEASIAVASYDSAGQLADAYRGAAGVFVHLPLAPEEDRIRYARNIVAALAEARPDRVVISTSGQVIDDPGSPLQHPDNAALPTLVRGIIEAGLSHAVIATRMFLENLLLPPVIEGVRSTGVLRYPLRANFLVSWASHLDVADVAVALFERADVSGLVTVGQYPPITGSDLAEAFSDRLGRSVGYEAIAPEHFGALATPLIGHAGAAAVIKRYTVLASLSDFTFKQERSAQQLLNVTPRTTRQWIDDLGM